MNPDQAIALVSTLMRTILLVIGPVLVASLVAGVVVAVIQTATQVNEASLSFLAKMIAVVMVGLAFGPQLATVVVDYARSNLEALAQVVR